MLSIREKGPKERKLILVVLKAFFTLFGKDGGREKAIGLGILCNSRNMLEIICYQSNMLFHRCFSDASAD